MTKRDVSKTIKALGKEIPRAGLVVGISSALFHLTMCFLRRLSKIYKLKLSKSKAALVSVLAATIPLILGLQKSEITILKLIAYPLAFQCLTQKLLGLGLLPNIKRGDILAYMIVTTPLVFCYINEGGSGKSVQTMIDIISTIRYAPDKHVNYVLP